MAVFDEILSHYFCVLHYSYDDLRGADRRVDVSIISEIAGYLRLDQNSDQSPARQKLALPFQE